MTLNVGGMETASGRVRAITVYCASSNAIDEEYMVLADAAGRGIAERGLELIYGGGSIGMMGRVADAAIAAGGRVRGVITRQLMGYEVSHGELDSLDVVESMHERKRAMTDAGDAFLVLPGGFGTLDEAIEAITWKQLRIHEKPIAIVNHRGYFDALLRFFAEAVDERFVHPHNLQLFGVAPGIDEAFEVIRESRMPEPETDALWMAPRP